MSAEVKILIRGYTNADTISEMGEERNCPTITLIREGDFTMIVDPGVLEDQQTLIDALSKEGISVNDVDMICITHSHIDHYRNIGMFPNAKVLEYFGIWDKNKVHSWSEQFSPNIQVLRTPGHTRTDITLFVTTQEGIVAICGDVFWKEEYPPDPQDDQFAVDPDELKNSRELVIKIADWIVPGHGDKYKIKKTSVLEEGHPKFIQSFIKPTSTCKKCRGLMDSKEKCLCRPWLCYKCCECGLDCDLCSCSHRRYNR